MIIKKGDLLPNLAITCTSDGAVVNLTSALSVQFVCRRDGQGTVLWTRSGTGDAQGVATYTWQAGDTATVGRLLFEVLVTWPGSLPQRFPAASYLPVDVIENLS